MSLRVAVVGAGPAGIYASDILSREIPGIAIDLFDRLPAPYGLVRYGVAPDHPRIKGIVSALNKVLARGDIRLLGNVDIGTDLTQADLAAHYDAVIFATGAIHDAALDIPGIDLTGSFGAADFVSWFDGHPDYPRTWPLEAREIAVIGAGNVALDVARMLAKHPKDLASTEIPANVAQGLAASPVTDVHVFAGAGPHRPSSRRWSCESWATSRTWTWWSTPRTSTSTRAPRRRWRSRIRSARWSPPSPTGR